MQQDGAIPVVLALPATDGGAAAGGDLALRPLELREGSVGELVGESAVVVLSKRGCCMGLVIRRLLLSLGVNPPVYEVEDEAAAFEELKAATGNAGGGRLEFPALFVGGRLFGGLDKIMATHISGELVPELKKAGALWL